MHQMDFISQEVSRMESTGRLIEEQACISNTVELLFTIIIPVITMAIFIVERTGTCGRRK